MVSVFMKKNPQLEVRRPNQLSFVNEWETNKLYSTDSQETVWALETESHENIYYLGGRAAFDTAYDS